MSQKNTLLVFSLSVLALSTFSCNGVGSSSNVVTQNTNNQPAPVNQTAAATPTPKKEGIISMEAGLVFQSGDIKPVARTTFYLLDESAIKLMRDAGVKPSKAKGSGNSDNDIAFSYGIDTKFHSNPSIIAANEAIQKRAIQTVTTDFGGKAKFSPVSQGTYYLFGISSTPKGFAIWNMKVDLTSAETSVTLDQNNAEIAL